MEWKKRIICMLRKYIFLKKIKKKGGIKERKDKGLGLPCVAEFMCRVFGIVVFWLL